MELIVAILLFAVFSAIFSKYVDADNQSSACEVFMKGALKAIIFMMIVLMVSYFLPNFSGEFIWKFVALTIGLALVSGILDLVARNKL